MKKIDTDLKKIVLAKVENYDDDWAIPWSKFFTRQIHW